MDWGAFLFGVVLAAGAVSFWHERHESDSYAWSMFWAGGCLAVAVLFLVVAFGAGPDG
jgi:hypothetical protein